MKESEWLNEQMRKNEKVNVKKWESWGKREEKEQGNGSRVVRSCKPFGGTL